MISIKKIILVLPKDVLNVFDLGYLGVETDYPGQPSSIPIRKKKNIELSQEEKDTTKTILKKE